MSLPPLPPPSSHSHPHSHRHCVRVKFGPRILPDIWQGKHANTPSQSLIRPASASAQRLEMDKWRKIKASLFWFTIRWKILRLLGCLEIRRTKSHGIDGENGKVYIFLVGKIVKIQCLAIHTVKRLIHRHGRILVWKCGQTVSFSVYSRFIFSRLHFKHSKKIFTSKEPLVKSDLRSLNLIFIF